VFGSAKPTGLEIQKRYQMVCFGSKPQVDKRGWLILMFKVSFDVWQCQTCGRKVLL